jgi:hypothetical protein
MRLSRSLPGLLLFLPFAPMTAQVPIASPITIDSARALLGTDPVAVPNVPASIYAMPGRSVLVVQRVDSEESVAFQETRGPTTFPINLAVPCPYGRTDARYDGAIGVPTCEELRLRARQRYRYIASLNVYLLYDRQVRSALSRPRNWQRVYPTERSFDIDDQADLRAEEYVGRVEPMKN